MGTFGGYQGENRIPAEKKAELSAHMEKLLNYGGMMQVDTVSLYGCEIHILKPAAFSEDGVINVWYNYFGDTMWENIVYDRADVHLRTRKIGSQEYLRVAAAAYTMIEVYDEGTGVSHIDGEIIDTKWIIGWINNILGTSFSMKKKFRLWENIEFCAFWRIDSGYGDLFFYRDLYSIIPKGMMYAAGGTELADLLYILNGTGTLVPEKVIPGTYPYDVLQCKNAVKSVLESGITEPAEEIWALLKIKDRKEREKIISGNMAALAELSLKLPARVIAYLTAEFEDLPFWETWRVMRDSAYHDEQIVPYAPDELLEKRKVWREAPVPKCRTSDFLREEDSLYFRNTPEELKDKPNYYISDDDRLFWWDGTDEVIISADADRWLRGLAARHRSLRDEMAPTGETGGDGFAERFVHILEDADSYYKRIFPFQGMFNEFVQNGHRKEYTAAIELFKCLCDENREDGKIIDRLGVRWYLTSRNVTNNIARLNLKRYLAVMANKKLREQYFGF